MPIARQLAWSAASALFGILLLSARQHVPVTVLALLIALAIASAWRPASGLAITSLLVPVATWLGRSWKPTLAWPEAVAIAFLIGYSARQALRRSREPADTLTVAIHGTIALVAASFAVQLVVTHRTIEGEALWNLLTTLATSRYFLGNGGIAGLDASMRLVEGLLLAHAGASIARENAVIARRLVASVAIGAAAAGALNLWRLWLSAIRFDSPLRAFLSLLATVRFNGHYRDVNAAGSYFIMALLPALSLIRAGSVWKWFVPVLLIAISLVLSGSRAAMLAGLVAGGAMWLITKGSPHGAFRRIGIVPASLIAAAIAITCGGVFYFGLQRNAVSSTTALRVRAEFTKISFSMFATRPLFGIGAGQYPARLTEFWTPELRAVYPLPHENAHNNFLQILAELGITGFAGFMCVLGIAGRRMTRFARADASGWIGRGACAGLLAFVLTWLSGHPLLIDAPAFSFWLLFGVVAGWAGQIAVVETTTTARRWRNVAPARLASARWGIAALMVVLVASIPLRARREINEANLEHIGIGVSQWQPEKDGFEYRLAGTVSTVFVPSYARVIELPLRAVEGVTDLRIEIYLDGRPADIVTVGSSAWHTLVLQIPQHESGRRFRPLELRIGGAPVDSEEGVLMIGKVAPRGS